MKTVNFPYLASGTGLVLLLLLVEGSKPDTEGGTVLPLLTLLIVNEFAFFISAAGGIIGIRHIISNRFSLVYSIITSMCLLLTAVFIWHGIKIWPGT